LQDVPAFVARSGLVFQDYLDARKPAILDAAHCARLNFEAYFFGDPWEKERFLSDPLVYCGLLTDPISRRRFRPRPDSPRTRHGEVTYYFESQANREIFEEDPEAFRLPGWKM
jgi:YHS domain-containing protein